MFYQNSNDLVKNASITSGHIQNSHETRGVLMKQIAVKDAADSAVPTANVNPNPQVPPSSGYDVGSSLDIGSKFQNMIQGLIHTVSMKEGMVANTDATVDQTKQQSKQFLKQELNHDDKVNSILKFIAKNDNSRRQNWVEVTDSNNVAKYGYITKDGIFQIWHAPTSPTSNWLGTDEMKKNTGIIGCPAASSSVQKIRIAGNWDYIKPFQLVYADNDTRQTNPVFMLGQGNVRSRNDGLQQFSCGEERGNVIVTERPSADLQFNSSDKMGCYVLDDNVTDSDLKNRGFTFQADLASATISQCKRRAEDLGSTHFLVSPPEPGEPNNRGGCWVYTESGTPNLRGLMTLASDDKCHNVGNQEVDEDVYLKAYPSTNLKRLYGKNMNVEIPLNPPNPECDHTTKTRCIFKTYHHAGDGICYPDNWNGTWAYGGLYNYSKNDLKGWLKHLHDRNGDGIERNAVNEYIEKCKVTQGYEFLDDNPVKRTKVVRSFGLYTLKSGGTTGVDVNNRNTRGSIGKIAYIDHNGERHEYPDSALSFVKATRENPSGNYVKVGNYDTRSAESSYAINEITPGSFSDAANLLYKATRDGWSGQKFHQLCDNKGATYTRATLSDGRVICGYTSVSWTSNPGYVKDTTAFLYDGVNKYTTAHGAWGEGEYAVYMNPSYLPTFGGGHDLFIGGQTMYINAFSYLLKDKSAPFTRKIQMGYINGPWVGRNIDAQVLFLENGQVVYAIEDDRYTKMVTGDRQEKYYTGSIGQFNPANWNNYSGTGGGKYLLNLTNTYKDFPRRGFGSYESHTLSEVEVYSVDPNTFPRSNPPDYVRRLRTMPVGESITASMQKCGQMCDDTDRCGGFVYTKSTTGGGDGKCELKDKTKMFPVGVRVADPTKELMLKVPVINSGIGDEECRVNNGKYKPIDSAWYSHYPDTGAMSSGTTCKMKKIIPKDGTLTSPTINGIISATEGEIKKTTDKTNEYRRQTSSGRNGDESFTTMREGMESSSNTYIGAMRDVSDNLLKIANAEYQRERLVAMTDESNKRLITESYKFILWSVLAILGVLALLKLKEMFGQDDPDEDGGGGGGGILATILGWLSIFKSANTSDIPDRTSDVKAAFSSASEQLKETTQQLASGITEGADNLVSSVNQAAEGAIEGAKGIANKVSETATDAVNQVGDAVSSATSGASSTTPASSNGAAGATTSGGSGNKRRK